MRLTRLAAAEVRRDPALLADALRERGFFPGPRVVLLEDAGDGLDEAVARALEGWQAGDAHLLVTAGSLDRKSPLKARFEAARSLACLILWDDPPTREEIAAELAKAGLTAFDPGAKEDLLALALALEPGDFRQLLEKVALYKWGDPAPLTAAEIAALAPLTIEAEVDAVVLAVADRRAGEVTRLLRRIEGQGVAPVTLAIAALRHFRTLMALGVDAAGASARLPWRAREAAQRQARAWRSDQLGRAVQLLVETDLTLRSSPRAPAFAIVERALMRLAASDPRG
jgi:DNA polymerase-3 subunit delta